MRLLGSSLSFLYLVCCIGACMPPDAASRKDRDKIQLDLRDPLVQRLYQFRDERRADSLKTYLNRPEATLRYLAALSFASWQDSTIIPSLEPLLKDPHPDVRTAAAFSIGQTGALSAEPVLIRAFASDDSLSEYQRFNAVLLEAIGKCGTQASLRNIATVSTYEPTDTLLLEGQCRAIYRFGQRKIVDTVATERMVSYVTSAIHPEPARLMAAHYLARTELVAPDSMQTIRIAAAFVRSSNPNIRMALARAMSKSAKEPAFAMLSKVIRTEQDWRVKCDIINALARFDYDTVRALVTPLISDPNPHVSYTAASFFIPNGRATDGDYYWRITTEREMQNMPWRTKIALFRASNRWLMTWENPGSKDFIIFRLRDMFLKSNDPYERAACLHALGEYGWQYRWIHDKGLNDTHPVVKSAAAEALRAIAERPDFNRVFGEGYRTARREIYAYLREIVAGGDAGMIAASAEAFLSPVLDYRALIDTGRIADLRKARQALKMPRDLEAYMALDKVLAHFEGRPAPPPYRPAYNHPIDWNLLNTLPKGGRVNMQTSKGLIVLELFPHWAPGSVAGFMKRIADGFYNGKTIHRVVPNFVVQDGCPRGDGYGALDYTLRTEIGMAWYDDEGYLGMASAGPDTEGTQWFITHSPTPHLDGRYTLFGKVLQGMDVVDQLQVGDKVEKMVLEK